MKYGTFKHLWVSLILLDRKNEAAAVIINHAAFLEEPLAKRYFPSWHCQVDHHGVVFLECAMQLFIYSLDHDSYRFRLKRWRGKSKITKTVPPKRFLNISQCLKISQKSLITLQEQGSKEVGKFWREISNVWKDIKKQCFVFFQWDIFVIFKTLCWFPGIFYWFNVQMRRTFSIQCTSYFAIFKPL